MAQIEHNGSTSSDEGEDATYHTERSPLIRGGGAAAAVPPPRGPPPAARSRSAAAGTVPMPPPPRPPSGPVPSPQQRHRQTISTQGQGQARPSPRQAMHPPPLPPPPMPPPPPPPPPPAICTNDWVLRVRHPGRGGIVRVHVSKGMTAYLLSRCIVQATDFSEDSIVGLFGYGDGMFISLEHLLSCHQRDQDEAQMLQKQLYSLYLPEPAPPTPWWDDWRVLAGIATAVGAILYTKLPTLLQLLNAIPVVLEELINQAAYYLPLFYHNLVTQPLKDTYRYGPNFVGGWEGASLPTICARITYNDKDFWERNYDDCRNMYLAKESAYLFVGRPLIFVVLLLMLAWIVRQWLWYHALRQNDNRHHYQDRDMIQTYRALQILFRQIHRMMISNSGGGGGGGHDRGGGRPRGDEYYEEH